MLNLTSVAPWLQNQGVYGPVTATLDWCEVNFQFSPYIAEMANTFSNIFTITLALCGGFQAMKERLPSRFPLGYAVRFFFVPIFFSFRPKYIASRKNNRALV